MVDLVRIVVAPGAHITISPHPSGLPVLGPLILFGGNTVDVAPERAVALYAAGLILHPVTGALPPAPEAMEHVAVPSVSYDNGPFQRMDSGLNIHPSWSATAATPISTEPQRAPMPATGHMHGVLPRPSISYGVGQSPEMATITAAEITGRSWPNF